jgi:hypothetical protein
LTVAERELLDKLPGAIKEDCAPATVAEGAAGGSVSLRCQMALSAAADEVWVDLFPSSATLGGAFSDAVARVQAPEGDCETTSLAQEPWEVPGVHEGNLLCYQDESAAWLVWTYHDDRILMRARRGGGDWQALLTWWDQTAIFLR